MPLDSGNRKTVMDHGFKNTVRCPLNGRESNGGNDYGLMVCTVNREFRCPVDLCQKAVRQTMTAVGLIFPNPLVNLMFRNMLAELSAKINI